MNIREYKPFTSFNVLYHNTVIDLPKSIIVHSLESWSSNKPHLVSHSFSVWVQEASLLSCLLVFLPTYIQVSYTSHFLWLFFLLPFATLLFCSVHPENAVNFIFWHQHIFRLKSSHAATKPPHKVQEYLIHIFALAEKVKFSKSLPNLLPKLPDTLKPLKAI